MAPLPKSVDVEIDPATWVARPVPAELVQAAATGTCQVDVLSALVFTAIWTRPPVTFGFSLSDTWAWLRYLPALCATSELRLCEDWSTLDPHQKTILSGDWGVGFTTWYLTQTLGFTTYADTLWVLKTIDPGSLILAESKKRGPKKSPDYIAKDGAGNYSVIECKGTQSSRRSLRDAVAKGVPQKENLTPGTTPVMHSLVAGLYVPQFESAERPLLLICDPEGDALRKEIFRFSKQQIARGVTQVALAKELALLEMPETATYFAGDKVRRSSLEAAISADMTRSRADRSVVDDGLVVHRDYIWERPTLIADGVSAVGARFQATIPRPELQRLQFADTPEALAEEINAEETQSIWTKSTDTESIQLTSPFGTKYSLELLT